MHQPLSCVIYICNSFTPHTTTVDGVTLSSVFYKIEKCCRVLKQLGQSHTAECRARVETQAFVTGEVAPELLFFNIKRSCSNCKAASDRPLQHYSILSCPPTFLTLSFINRLFYCLPLKLSSRSKFVEGSSLLCYLGVRRPTLYTENQLALFKKIFMQQTF